MLTNLMVATAVLAAAARGDGCGRGSAPTQDRAPSGSGVTITPIAVSAVASQTQTPTTTPPQPAVSKSEAVAPRSASPYKACVRDAIEYEVASIKRSGGTPDYKEVEKTAVFSCEATNECVGQRECDAKMRAHSEKDQREHEQVLDKWK